MTGSFACALTHTNTHAQIDNCRVKSSLMHWSNSGLFTVHANLPLWQWRNIKMAAVGLRVLWLWLFHFCRGSKLQANSWNECNHVHKCVYHYEYFISSMFVSFMERVERRYVKKLANGDELCMCLQGTYDLSCSAGCNFTAAFVWPLEWSLTG